VLWAILLKYYLLFVAKNGGPMNRKSIRWQLPSSYAVIAMLAALTLGSMMLLVLRSYYADQEREYLYGNATALRPVIEQILQSDLPEASLQDQIKGLAFLSQTQIRLLDTNGNTIADSGILGSNQVVAISGGAPVAGNVMFSAQIDRSRGQAPILIYRNDVSMPFPQVVPFEKQISAGKAADIILSVNASPYGYGFVQKIDSDFAKRSSQSVGVLLMASNGSNLGMLEFSHGPSYGAAVIQSVALAWLIASVFAISIAALSGWFMSQRVTRPVLALQKATHQMEQGILSVRVDLPLEKQQEFVSLAHSFNGMAEQVEQTVSTLREFVADAAHELHTPLTALQANIELARDEENASQRARYLANAREQGQRLESLVKNLLDLSRIEAAEAKSRFALLDIIQLVKEVSEQFASRAEQAERGFKVSVLEHSLMVSGNEHQLKQVLTNVLDNSFKFTPRDGRIELRVEQAQNEVHLTVTDTGIGIPPDDMAHLFERFHRARNASGFAGNGLGLAITKAIVTAHGGHITVESQSMNGTSIKLSIPISK